jgi:integrase
MRYIETGEKTAGKVTPLTNLRKRLRDIRAAAELTDWVQDVMRHSYASYWLAHHGDINRLTLQMGHESADMLWKHYHKASKRKEAAKYWQIMPSARAATKIVSFGAAS